MLTAPCAAAKHRLNRLYYKRVWSTIIFSLVSLRLSRYLSLALLSRESVRMPLSLAYTRPLPRSCSRPLARCANGACRPRLQGSSPIIVIIEPSCYSFSDTKSMACVCSSWFLSFWLEFWTSNNSSRNFKKGRRVRVYYACMYLYIDDNTHMYDIIHAWMFRIHSENLIFKFWVEFVWEFLNLCRCMYVIYMYTYIYMCIYICISIYTYIYI